MAIWPARSGLQKDLFDAPHDTVLASIFCPSLLHQAYHVDLFLALHTSICAKLPHSLASHWFTAVACLSEHLLCHPVLFSCFFPSCPFCTVWRRSSTGLCFPMFFYSLNCKLYGLIFCLWLDSAGFPATFTSSKRVSEAFHLARGSEYLGSAALRLITGLIKTAHLWGFKDACVAAVTDHKQVMACCTN